jgi:ABC-type transport system substrate-binding protein
MIRAIRGVAAATALALVLPGGTAAAQRAGGVLRVYSAESPPGLNIYEQATPWGQGPLMGVNYCNKEVDKLIEQQSMEGDPARRKQILWQIERKLADEDARPIIFYAAGGTCMRPWVKGQIVLVNSIFSGARREDVWLDK